MLQADIYQNDDGSIEIWAELTNDIDGDKFKRRVLPNGKEIHIRSRKKKTKESVSVSDEWLTELFNDLAEFYE